VIIYNMGKNVALE